jgi:hypothetical protein
MASLVVPVLPNRSQRLSSALPARSGALAHHRRQQLVGHEGIALADGALRFGRRRRLVQGLAVLVDDGLDQPHRPQQAAAGEHRIGAGHLQRSDGAGAQRQREVLGLALDLQPELRRPLPHPAHAEVLDDADRHHVLRSRNALAQGQEVLVGGVVILRCPVARLEGLVADQGAAPAALFDERRVDEGLERGAGLAVGLGGVVELSTREVEASHQGAHRSAGGVQGHHRALGLRGLRQAPLRGLALGSGVQQSQQAAALQRVLGARAQQRRQGAQCRRTQIDLAAVAQQHLDALGLGPQHQGGAQFPQVGVAVEGAVHRGVELRVVGRGQIELRFGAAERLAALEVEERAAQPGLGGALLLGQQGGAHLQAPDIGLLAEALQYLGAHHLGDMVGHRAHALGSADRQGRIARRVGLRLAHHAGVHQHAQHHRLAFLGARQVGDRVAPHRVLGQADEQRGLGQVQGRQLLAEVALGRRSKAVGAVAQEDLVHVDLEDLPLAQFAFDLQRQQQLDELAAPQLTLAQESVARQLLGDGRCALTRSGARQVAPGGPRDAAHIQTGVGPEVAVLDRQQGLTQGLGHFIERHEAASLAAELADQHLVLCVDAQRLPGAVVAQAVEFGQLLPGDRHGDAQYRQRQQDQRRQREQHQSAATAPWWLWGCRGGSAVHGGAAIMLSRCKPPSASSGTTTRPSAVRPVSIAPRSSPPSAPTPSSTRSARPACGTAGPTPNCCPSPRRCC